MDMDDIDVCWMLQNHINSQVFSTYSSIIPQWTLYWLTTYHIADPLKNISFYGWRILKGVDGGGFQRKSQC